MRFRQNPRKTVIRGSFAALATLVLAGPVAVSSAKTVSASHGAAANDISITVVAPQLGNPFYVPIQFGANQAGKDLKVKVNYVGPAQADPQKTVALIQAATQQKVDGIVVICGDPTSNVSAINAAVAAGIPVVTTNTDCPTSKRRVFYGANFQQEGKISADLLKAYVIKNRYPQPLKIVIGNCAPGFQALSIRRDAFLKRAKAIGLKIDYLGEFNSTLDTAKSLTAYQNQVAAHPDVNVLYGTCAVDTRNAGLMSQRGKNNKGQKILAFGYDLLPDTLNQIKSGDVLWSLGQSPYEQGYVPVKYIVDFLRSKKAIPRGFVPAATEIVTTQSALKPVAARYPVAKLRTNVDAIIKRESKYYKK